MRGTKFMRKLIDAHHKVVGALLPVALVLLALLYLLFVFLTIARNLSPDAPVYDQDGMMSFARVAEWHTQGT